jgi:hypothetical protein
LSRTLPERRAGLAQVEEPGLCRAVTREAEDGTVFLERLMMLLTATGDQGVPRALGTPRAVSARATPRSDVTPLAWIDQNDERRFPAPWREEKISGG